MQQLSDHLKFPSGKTPCSSLFLERGGMISTVDASGFRVETVSSIHQPTAHGQQASEWNELVY